MERRTATTRGDDQTAIRVPVRLSRNSDEGTWSYTIELPTVVGGCFATRDDAARAAGRALAGRLSRTPRVEGRSEELEYIELRPAPERRAASRARATDATPPSRPGFFVGPSWADLFDPCPYTLEGMATCPYTEPAASSPGDRGAIPCRHFAMHAHVEGLAGVCTKPALG